MGKERLMCTAAGGTVHVSYLLTQVRSMSRTQIIDNYDLFFVVKMSPIMTDLLWSKAFVFTYKSKKIWKCTLSQTNVIVSIQFDRTRAHNQSILILRVVM